MHFILVAGMYLKSWLGAGVFTPAENVPKVISMDICDRSLTITGIHSSPNQEQAHLSFCQVAITNKGDNPENLELLMAPRAIWSLKSRNFLVSAVLSVVPLSSTIFQEAGKISLWNNRAWELPSDKSIPGTSQGPATTEERSWGEKASQNI